MTADQEQHQNQNNNKRKYKAACNCEQPKNISRFRPYKKEKTTTKKKFVKSKLHSLKTKYVLLTDSFISTIVTKNRKVPFYLNGLFIKPFFCLYYTAWLRKAQIRIGQNDPQVVYLLTLIFWIMSISLF